MQQRFNNKINPLRASMFSRPTLVRHLFQNDSQLARLIPSDLLLVVAPATFHTSL
jgi:hypothetical protein